MASYADQRIATLTDVATSTPQFQPSQNVGVGVASVLGMAMDSFQKISARNELADLQAAEEQRASTVNDYTLKLRDLRDNLVQQKASRLDIAEAENELLSQLPDDLKIAVIGSTNKLTGRTRAQSLDAAEKELDERRGLERQAADLAGFLGKPYDFSTLSDEQLHKLVLEGTAKQSQLTARNQELAVRAQQTNNANQARQLKVKALEETLVMGIGNEISRQVLSGLQAVDMNNQGQVKQMLEGISENRLAIKPMILEQASRRGISLSTDELEQMEANFISTFDTASEILLQDKTAKMGKNVIANKMSDILNTMSESSNPRFKQAGIAMGLSSAFGVQPPTESYSDFIRGAIMAAGGNGSEPATVAGVPQEKSWFDKFGNKLGELFKGVTGEGNEEAKKFTGQLALKVFSGTDEEVDNAVRSGTITSMLDGLANGNIEGTVPQEKRPEIMRRMRDVLERTLSPALEKLIAVPAAAGSDKTVARRPNSIDGMGFDPNTLMFSGKQQGSITSTVRTGQQNWNRLITNTLKAYENLGASEAFIEDFKQTVRNSVGIQEMVQNGQEENKE